MLAVPTRSQRQDLPDTVAVVGAERGAAVRRADCRRRRPGRAAQAVRRRQHRRARLRDGAVRWSVKLAAEKPLAADAERVYVAAGEAIHALDGGRRLRSRGASVGGRPITAAAAGARRLGDRGRRPAT